MGAGSYTYVGTGGYDRTRAMAALGNHLYIVDGGTLYKVAPDGSYEEIADGYTEATAMTASGGALWIVNGGSLYRVEG